MKIITAVVLLLLSSFSLADKCTGQVKGFLAALKTENYISHAQREQASKEAKRIESLREKLSDCEVRATIPALAMTDKATNIAVNAAKAMEKQDN